MIHSTSVQASTLVPQRMLITPLSLPLNPVPSAGKPKWWPFAQYCGLFHFIRKAGECCREVSGRLSEAGRKNDVLYLLRCPLVPCLRQVNPNGDPSLKIVDYSWITPLLFARPVSVVVRWAWMLTLTSFISPSPQRLAEGWRWGFNIRGFKQHETSSSSRGETMMGMEMASAWLFTPT